MNEKPKQHHDWLRLPRAILALVGIIMLFLAAAVWLMPIGNRARNALSPLEAALVGDWVLDEPDGPGTVRVLQFRPDHTGSSTDLSTANEVIQSAEVRWSLNGNLLVICERSSLQRMLGRSGEQTNFRVESLTDRQLRFAMSNGEALTYKRGASAEPLENQVSCAPSGVDD